ncbi:restriction endonuclease [Planococcus faecalis]|uniref:restriction endonuclease n=1 Tax=Planococcus faecalis TaxID=1598147 RepID=UPI0008DAED49|nr:restriction endonuclease [Planococcus faecalis]OHX51662.1 hypothetical protein BB777_15940 [Planococcus faecalis]
MNVKFSNDKPIWMVRAGSHGQQEEIALEENIIAIGWRELGDLDKVDSKAEIEDKYEKIYLNTKPKAVSNRVNQIWRFKKEIKKGDWVVLPLKIRPVIAIGRIVGNYEFTDHFGPEIGHYRQVEWFTKDMPRSEFKQDLLYSMGAFLTVCKIQRNDAEIRIPKALNTYLNVGAQSITGSKALEIDEIENGEKEEIDIETMGRDQIRSMIKQEFAGHRLQDLVAGIFSVEGYMTDISPPGKDGGVDILAGKGLLGLEEPRICVQVKATTTPAGIDVVNSLLGVVSSYGASYGLIVSTGGFTSDARKKAKEQFFKLRLWDSDDLIEAILKNYLDLSDEIKASLPLKQIWVGITEELE